MGLFEGRYEFVKENEGYFVIFIIYQITNKAGDFDEFRSSPIRPRANGD